MDHAARRAAPLSRPYREQKGLRPRPMRRLHRSPRRSAHLFVPHAGSHEGWRADHDHRRSGARKHASPVAAGVHRRGHVRQSHGGISGGETMNNFGYARASDVADAVRQIAADPGAKFIAGGTNLIDLMKENVARPSRLIDITHLPRNKIEETQDGGLRIGALVPNSDLAYDPRIEARYPLLS